MGTQDIKIYVSSISSIEPRSYGQKGLEIEVNDMELDSLFDDLSISDAVEHFGEEELLEKIGRDKAIEYFGIEEKN